MIPRLLIAVLVLATLGGCGGDEADEAEALRGVRDDVVAQAGPVVDGLLAGLPATMKTSFGRYVSCRSSLDGQPTAFRFELAAHLRLARTPGTAELATVAGAFEQAGFTVEEQADGLVQARRGELLALAQDTPAEPVIRLLFSHGACHEVGKQRTGEFRSTIRDILG